MVSNGTNQLQKLPVDLAVFFVDVKGDAADTHNKNFP